MGREEVGLQTSLISMLDPSEFSAPTVEDLLVTAACSRAGRYPQTCDQLRELLTAYKSELLALNTNQNMCVYICIYICKHTHKSIICLCRLIISCICPKVLIQQSSQAEGKNHVALCCVYTHPDSLQTTILS